MSFVSALGGSLLLRGLHLGGSVHAGDATRGCFRSRRFDPRPTDFATAQSSKSVCHAGVFIQATSLFYRCGTKGCQTWHAVLVLSSVFMASNVWQGSGTSRRRHHSRVRSFASCAAPHAAVFLGHVLVLTQAILLFCFSHAVPSKTIKHVSQLSEYIQYTMLHEFKRVSSERSCLAISFHTIHKQRSIIWSGYNASYLNTQLEMDEG
eukprot:4659158-Amphidinium_carterae.1